MQMTEKAVGEERNSVQVRRKECYGLEDLVKWSLLHMWNSYRGKGSEHDTEQTGKKYTSQWVCPVMGTGSRM